MLDMFYQGLGIIADNSFTNITWGKCCFSHSSSCWHSRSCWPCSCCCSFFLCCGCVCYYPSSCRSPGSSPY